MKKLLFVFMIILLAACGEYSQLNTDGDGLTTVGNPNPTPLPQPTESYKVGVEKLLQIDENWEWSFPGERSFEDIYIAKFNVTEKTVQIRVFGSTVEYNADLEIKDDGSVTAEDEDGLLKISGKYNSETDSIKLFAEREDVSSQIFSADSSVDLLWDGISDTTSLCKNSSDKYLQPTIGIQGNSEKHMATFLQLSDETGNECRLVIDSYCVGNTAVRPIPYKDSPNGFDFAMENVECETGCQNGKCIGEVPEEEYDSWLSFLNPCWNPSNSCHFTYGIPLEELEGVHVPSDFMGTYDKVHDYLEDQL